MFKQVIVVRADLKMSRGKAATQVAHASIGAFRKSSALIKTMWQRDGEKKVVVQAENVSHLLELKKKADSLKLPNAIISDAGLTELEPGTVTCLGIGPAKGDDIDKVTGSLRLLD